MASKIPFPEDKTGPALFKNYLKERGIKPETVVSCGLEVVSRDVAWERIGHKFSTQYRTFLYIPFPESKYSVVRGLGNLDGTFQALLAKSNKLLCPEGKPEVYIPPTTEWQEDLYICESAIKAMVMAQHGYAAIGGNGVSGVYTNSGFSKGFPTDLLDGGEVKRVVILFDANWQTNIQVQAAVRKLAAGINYAHPNVQIIHKQLPLTDSGEDQGIDDFFVREGEELVKQWLDSDVGSVEVELSDRNKHFDELNENYVITRSHSNLIDRIHKRRVSRSDFTELVEAKRIYIEEVRAGQGTRKVEKSAAKEWLRWEDNNMVDEQVYRPGEPELNTNANPSYYNTYMDDGDEALAPPADITAEEWVEPFLSVYKNAAPEDIERQLLLQSVAWMKQNPKQRMKKCFCFIGADQGTGKSLFTDILGRVFGMSNWASVSSHNFGNNFNASLVGRQIVVLDDLMELQTKSKGLFKNFVTGESFMAEMKGKDAVKTPSTAVLFITTNEFKSIPLDPEDRRVHIVSFEPTVMYHQGDDYWLEFIAWLKDGGYGKIRWWLEQLDLEGFNPDFLPPLTATKIHMRQSAMDEVELWVDSLWSSTDEELCGNKRSFYTIEEIAVLYAGRSYGSMDSNEVRSLIRKLGVFLPKRYQRVGNNAITTTNGRARYWGIRKEGGKAQPDEVKADVGLHGTLTIT